LVLFPGLGADARLFGRQQDGFPDLVVPPWLEPRSRESLEDYGQRMAQTIEPHDRLYIGGASFGGMVALEAAQHLPTRGVILLGSCVSPASIPPRHRLAARVCAVLPCAMMRWCPMTGPLLTHMLGAGRGRAERDLLLDMFKASPAPFIRWGCRAMCAWRGRADATLPVWHIHGAADRMIPVRYVRPTRVVPGAGHVLTMTHPDEVNAFIVDIVNSEHEG
jgi:pimeloyl-ACP methyl ester carboxylesterase